jgi:hypothetical protein
MFIALLKIAVTWKHLGVLQYIQVDTVEHAEWDIQQSK